MGFGDDHPLGSHRGRNVLALLRRWVQRRVRRPEAAVRAAKDPTASIQAVPDALAVAESLLGSAPLVCGAYWGAVTVRPLAALLYAAGPNGEGRHRMGQSGSRKRRYGHNNAGVGSGG
jgi:hypothetical protein